MRPSVYPEKIVLYVTPEDKAEIQAKATSERVTIAELLRQAVRREVREAA